MVLDTCVPFQIFPILPGSRCWASFPDSAATVTANSDSSDFTLHRRQRQPQALAVLPQDSLVHSEM